MRYLIILLFPVCLNAQSVGIGHSVKFWGTSTDITKIQYIDDNFYLSASYKHYIHYQAITFSVGKKVVSYKFLKLFLTASSRPYPVYPSSMYNFMISVDILKADNLMIQYHHTSNGLGLFRDVNLGVDFFTISVKI